MLRNRIIVLFIYSGPGILLCTIMTPFHRDFDIFFTSHNATATTCSPDTSPCDKTFLFRTRRTSRERNAFRVDDNWHPKRRRRGHPSRRSVPEILGNRIFQFSEYDLSRPGGGGLYENSKSTEIGKHDTFKSFSSEIIIRAVFETLL